MIRGVKSGRFYLCRNESVVRDNNITYMQCPTFVIGISHPNIPQIYFHLSIPASTSKRTSCKYYKAALNIEILVLLFSYEYIYALASLLYTSAKPFKYHHIAQLTRTKTPLSTLMVLSDGLWPFSITFWHHIITDRGSVKWISTNINSRIIVSNPIIYTFISLAHSEIHSFTIMPKARPEVRSISADQFSHHLSTVGILAPT